MAEDISNKLVISVALVGSATTKEQNPAVPYTPEEFGVEAKKCFDAGASTVHIHARDKKTGWPTPDLNQIKAVIDSINEKAPEIIINITSSVGITLIQPSKGTRSIAFPRSHSSLMTQGS